MKQYVIDDLRLQDHIKLKEHLDKHLDSSPISGLYWLELDEDILTSVQKEHVGCKPHVFVLKLEERCLSCEFLVRIKKSIKCDCMGYATILQRNRLMEIVDAMLESLDIQA